MSLPDSSYTRFTQQLNSLEMANANFSVGAQAVSPEMMNQFLQFVTDRVLVDFGLPREFNVTQPLAYMDKVLMETRSNFFEAKSGTYTQVTRSETKFDEDF